MNAGTETVSRMDDWDRHWDDYASSAERNPAQRFRRKLILSLLGDASQPPARVLDIGSGQGDFAAELVASYPTAEVLGLELSASGVEAAARKVPRAACVQCSLLDRKQPPEYRRN